MKRILSFLLLASCVAYSQTSPTKPISPFEGLGFLFGDWIGTGSGDPGKGSGGFSFKLGLDGHVLVRQSFAEYPATKDRPAFRHDDHTDVFEEGGKLKAIYFDSEGHVIHYLVSTEKDGAIFLSEGEGPRYRLSYHSLGANRVGIKFEIAPPGASDFKTYIDATAERKR